MPDDVQQLGPEPGRPAVALRRRRRSSEEESAPRSTDRWWVLGSAVAVLVVWQLVSLVAGRTGTTGQRFVPNAYDIVHSFNDLAYYWWGGLGVHAVNDGGSVGLSGALLSLLGNTLYTLVRLVIGLAIGIGIAVLLASAVSWSAVVRRMLLPIAHASRMLPLLAMSPLFGVWFGESELGAVLFVAFASFAVVFIIALTAIANVPPHYEQSARSLGASSIRAYATVVLPAALPALRGAVLLALGFGWSMVIAAEFIGQDRGLGNIVNRAQQFGRTETLAVLAVVVVVLGWSSYKLASRGFDRLTRWTE